jgi:hypothetical protein
MSSMNVFERISLSRDPLKGRPFGNMVKCLSAIKEHYLEEGWQLFECDIRKNGEQGVRNMHTEMMQFRASREHVRRTIRARIHRTPSDVYIIDSCEFV